MLNGSTKSQCHQGTDGCLVSTIHYGSHLVLRSVIQTQFCGTLITVGNSQLIGFQTIIAGNYYSNVLYSATLLPLLRGRESFFIL